MRVITQKLKPYLAIGAGILVIFALGVVFIKTKTSQKTLTNSPVQIQIPLVYTEPLVIQTFDFPVMIKPVAAQAAQREEIGPHKFRFIESYPATDIIQEIKPNRLKESIVLKKPGHPAKFVYDLGDISQYEVSRNSKGDLIFSHSQDKMPNVEPSLRKIFTIPAPYLIDARGNKSSPKDVQMILEGNKLVLIPSKDWLKEHPYPIILDPTVEIHILNLHSHPSRGQDWVVNFTTLGTADLYIIPTDQATIDDDVFTGLYCGSEKRTPKILQGDVIYYPNWQCQEIAKVVHYTAKAGKHTLRFEFGDVSAYAYNTARDPDAVKVYLQATKNDWDQPDNGSPTDKTSCYTDNNTGTTCNRISKQKEVVRIEFNSGLSSLSAGDTVTINIKKLRNAGDIYLLPYTSASGVSTTNKLTLASANLVLGNNTFTLTSAFINDLYDQGGGAFAFRLVAVDFSYQMADRAEITEIDADLTSAPSNPTFTQNYYRWYQNADALQPTTAWSNLSENSAISQSDSPPGTGEIVRLRMSIQIGSADLSANAQAFKLQYGQGANCSAIGTWTDVGALGSGVIWRGYDNPTPADGATISSTLLSVSDVAGTYEEANNSATNPNAATVGSDIEYDWVIENNGATAGTQYCFRMVKSDGTALDTYTNYPQLYTNSTPAITSVTDSPDPVAVGSDVTFSVNWSDADTGDSIKAKVCKTNSLTNQNCDGGFWASSTAFTTNNPESVAYTAQSGDLGTQSYYVFVCDDSGACSSSQSGTFNVASSPTITSVEDKPDPAEVTRSVRFIIRWDNSNNDQAKAKVCKTNSLTNQNCDGGFWASSTAFTDNGRIRLIYDIDPADAGQTYNYYVYLCNDSGLCSGPSSGTFSVKSKRITPILKFR